MPNVGHDTGEVLAETDHASMSRDDGYGSMGTI